MTCIYLWLFTYIVMLAFFFFVGKRANFRMLLSTKMDSILQKMLRCRLFPSRGIFGDSSQHFLLSLGPISLDWPLSCLKPLGSKGVLLLWTTPRCLEFPAAKNGQRLPRGLQDRASFNSRLHSRASCSCSPYSTDLFDRSLSATLLFNVMPEQS